MPKSIFAILFLLFISYTAYDVFLSENALVKRSSKTVDANGGYVIVTKQDDGSQLIETYEVHADGTPKSHALVVQGTDPNSEPWVMKKGSFEPKFK